MISSEDSIPPDDTDFRGKPNTNPRPNRGAAIGTPRKLL
jgi:hypothetical protein